MATLQLRSHEDSTGLTAPVTEIILNRSCPGSVPSTAALVSVRGQCFCDGGWVVDQQLGQAGSLRCEGSCCEGLSPLVQPEEPEQAGPSRVRA